VSARWPAKQPIDELVIKSSAYFMEVAHDLRKRLKAFTQPKVSHCLSHCHVLYFFHIDAFFVVYVIFYVLCYWTSHFLLCSLFILAHYFSLLLGLDTVSVRVLWNGCCICHLSICLLSVPRQISRSKRDTYKIMSPLQEIGVAKQEYNVRFCTESS